MPDEIRLDKKTFEALAMGSRVKILKALKERRKTQSELSKELNLAVSTVSQHLDKLVDAKLVKRKQQGKKWVYYELTTTAGGILSPSARGVFVFALSISLLLIVLGSMTMSGTTNVAMYAPASGETPGAHNGEVTSEDDIGGENMGAMWLPNILVNSIQEKYTDGVSTNKTPNETGTDMYIAGYRTQEFINWDAVIVLLMGTALLVGTIAYGIKRKKSV